MLLGVYVLLMRYYDWREWATLLDSRVPNNHDIGTMPDAYHSSFTSPSSMPAENRTWILFSICTSESSLESDLPPVLPGKLSRRSRTPEAHLGI